MFPDCREHGRVVDAVALASELRSKRRVQHDRIAPLEVIEPQAARRALAQEALGRIQAREVVQQAREARTVGAFAVLLGQAVGEASDADRMGETMLLGELFADGAREGDEG
jgi:hypothetical protein